MSLRESVCHLLLVFFYFTMQTSNAGSLRSSSNPGSRRLFQTLYSSPAKPLHTNEIAVLKRNSHTSGEQTIDQLILQPTDIKYDEDPHSTFEVEYAANLDLRRSTSRDRINLKASPLNLQRSTSRQSLEERFAVIDPYQRLSATNHLKQLSPREILADLHKSTPQTPVTQQWHRELNTMRREIRTPINQQIMTTGRSDNDFMMMASSAESMYVVVIVFYCCF